MCDHVGILSKGKVLVERSLSDLQANVVKMQVVFQERRGIRWALSMFHFPPQYSTPLNGAVDFGSLCMWLVVQSLLCFFFYAFAVFCAMFTGHLLALPAFYGILNILASALMFLIQHLAQEFIYGFDSLSRATRQTSTAIQPFQLSRMTRKLFFRSISAAKYRRRWTARIPRGISSIPTWTESIFRPIPQSI